MNCSSSSVLHTRLRRIIRGVTGERPGYVSRNPAIGEGLVNLFHHIVKNIYIPCSTFIFRIKVAAPVIPHSAICFFITVNIDDCPGLQDRIIIIEEKNDGKPSGTIP